MPVLYITTHTRNIFARKKLQGINIPHLSGWILLVDRLLVSLSLGLV